MPVRQSMLEVLRNVTSEMSKSCCCCSNQAVFVLVQALHDEYPAAALIANTFGLLPCHAASGGAQSLLRESFARQADIGYMVTRILMCRLGDGRDEWRQ